MQYAGDAAGCCLGVSVSHHRATCVSSCRTWGSVGRVTVACPAVIATPRRLGWLHRTRTARSCAPPGQPPIDWQSLRLGFSKRGDPACFPLLPTLNETHPELTLISPTDWCTPCPTSSETVGRTECQHSWSALPPIPLLAKKQQAAGRRQAAVRPGSKQLADYPTPPSPLRFEEERRTHTPLRTRWAAPAPGGRCTRQLGASHAGRTRRRLCCLRQRTTRRRAAPAVRRWTRARRGSCSSATTAAAGSTATARA